MTAKIPVVQPAPDHDVSAAVRARLGNMGQLSRILPIVQAVAQDFEGVYLVGGAVRDLLLGSASVDIDLMVEGDALDFSRRLAREIGVSTRLHERFETAVVTGRSSEGADVRVDVASARTETYAAPGALPEVKRSTLRHDLARRDFTINAMATSLRAQDLGGTYDFFGGFRDLEGRTIRVLHDRSFMEDPTRLLRALRYEARFGFSMDDHTLSLALARIGAGLLGHGGSTRLRDELLDLLGESHAQRAVERMNEIGADRALYPQLDAGPRAVELMRGADAAALTEPFASETRVRLVRLACLCASMAAPDVNTWLERIRMPRRDQDIVVEAVAAAPLIAEALSASPTPRPSVLRDLLEDRPVEALVMAIAMSSDREHTRAGLAAYLERIRSVALSITGDDLKRCGVSESPELGQALRTTLALKLDGFVQGRDDELTTALRLLGRSAP